MSPLRLMSRRRGLKLGLLLLNGMLQAAASLAIAATGSALLDAQGGTIVNLITPALVAATPGAVPWAMGGGLILGSAVLVGLRILQRRSAEAFALDYVHELRSALFKHVLALPKSNPKLRYGLVMTRILNDMSAVKLWLAYGLASLLVSIAVLLPVVGFLAFAYPPLAVGVIPGIGIWALIVMMSASPLRRAIRESRRQRGRLAAFAGSALASRLALQHFGRSGPTIRAIERRSDRLNAALIRRATHSGLLRSAGELLYPTMILATAGFIGTGGAAVDTSLLGFGFVLTGLLAIQLNGAAQAVDYRLAHIEAMRRIEAILSEPTVGCRERQAEATIPRTQRGKGLRLEIDQVLPREGTRKNEVQQAFAINVEPGETIRVDSQDVTTRSRLFAMIAGLEEVDTGDIRIAGISIHDADLRWWRRTVTLISPSIPLVRGSFDDNVLLGAPSSTTEAFLMEVKTLFGLDVDDSVLTTDIRDDTHVDPSILARLRAARGLMRSASVVLIDDPDVQDTADILEPLLAALTLRGATVLINVR